MMATTDFVHESFWVAAATVAPVIGLAHSVLIGRNLERVDKWRNELAVTVDYWTKASEAIDANEERLEAEQAETSELRNRIEEDAVRAGSSDEEDFNAPVRKLASAFLDLKSASLSNSHRMDLLQASAALMQLKISASHMKSAVRWVQAANWTSVINLGVMAAVLGASMWALDRRSDTLSPGVIVWLLILAMISLIIASRADIKTGKRVKTFEESREAARSVVGKALQRKVLPSGVESLISSTFPESEAGQSEPDARGSQLL